MLILYSPVYASGPVSSLKRMLGTFMPKRSKTRSLNWLARKSVSVDNSLCSSFSKSLRAAFCNSMRMGKTQGSNASAASP